MIKREWFAAMLFILLGLGATACTAVQASTSKPTAVITSPASNSQFQAGEPVMVQSTSTDSAGITRVELSVDGTVVHTDPSPSPQQSFTVLETWMATQGTHTISVRSVNTAGVFSDPATIQVEVSAATTPTPTATSTAAPTPTSTRAPAQACTNHATFVTDVTIPDGSTFAPGQSFTKTWRVHNTGTCTWGTGYTLVFVSGTSMTTTAASISQTAPGATADLSVNLTAPTAQGAYTGVWQLEKNGTRFGTILTMKINVSAAAANPCPFTPAIEGFSASPTTIIAGQSATLNWGFVAGAQTAEIDNGIGGVATPGSRTVSPTTTTTYTLTAICQSKVRTAQVTINVISPSPTP
jgi:Ig-like domain from next to BRCA1 gene/Bacterial Ig domain